MIYGVGWKIPRAPTKNSRQLHRQNYIKTDEGFAIMDVIMHRKMKNVTNNLPGVSTDSMPSSSLAENDYL